MITMIGWDGPPPLAAALWSGDLGGSRLGRRVRHRVERIDGVGVGGVGLRHWCPSTTSPHRSLSESPWSSRLDRRRTRPCRRRSKRRPRRDPPSPRSGCWPRPLRPWAYRAGLYQAPARAWSRECPCPTAMRCWAPHRRHRRCTSRVRQHRRCQYLFRPPVTVLIDVLGTVSINGRAADSSDGVEARRPRPPSPRWRYWPQQSLLRACWAPNNGGAATPAASTRLSNEQTRAGDRRLLQDVDRQGISSGPLERIRHRRESSATPKSRSCTPWALPTDALRARRELLQHPDTRSGPEVALCTCPSK